METTHRVFFENSNDMKEIGTESIDLMITSPPYPMIEMWDGLFSSLNKEIKHSIKKNNGEKAFKLMHGELNKVWGGGLSCSQAGGMACVNMGDATRKINSSFQLYPNHVKITEFFLKKDFSVLPDILWRKQTNKANKFMGSGMLPTNAYVTLEHEYILIFRKGKKPRNFKPKSKRRYNSAYFWEERNKWFSDIWFDIKGTLQNLNNNELRDRAAAFPIELPYRLINMYSVQGDTVLDPFWGTGTTSLAAMISARNSVGYELEKDFMKVFDKRVKKVKRINEAVNKGRIQRHLTFQKEREKEGKELSYKASNYNFNVTTKQERKIRFYSIEHLKKERNVYKVVHHARDQPVGDTLSEQT